MFAALNDRRYRRLWIATTISGFGDWMQIFARSALALRVTDGDANAVGIVVAATYLPQIFGSLYGGVIADRFDRRRIVMFATLVQAIAAGAIAAVSVWGTPTIAFLAAASLVMGAAFTISLPASQALLPSLVGMDLVPSAVELGVFSSSVSRVVGPLVALAISNAWGLESVFFGNAISFLGIVAVWLVTPIARHVPSALNTGIRSAARFAKERPVLWVPMVISAVLSSIGVLYQPLSGVFARYQLAGGREALGESMNGWLQAAIGLGAAVGISLLAKWGRPNPRATLLASGAAGSVLLIVAAQMTTLVGACIMFGLAAAALFANMTLAIALVQSHAANDMRGRLMGLHLTGVLGFLPLTVFGGSWLVQSVGVVSVIAGSGVVCLLFVVVATRFPRFDNEPAELGSLEAQQGNALLLAEEGS